MAPGDRCDRCAHWDNRPELEMAANVGYCDYHEKTFKADYWCKFFLNKSSQEAKEYKREIYGGGEDEDEQEDADA